MSKESKWKKLINLDVKNSKVNNINKNIPGIVNEVIKERSTNDGLQMNKKQIFNEHIKDLLLDNKGKLSNELKMQAEATVFLRHRR